MQELLNGQPDLLITLVGIGGCGCNTVNMLNEAELSDNVRLIAINTDLAVLNHSTVETKVLIGQNLTNGYGAGADPAIGLRAAQESKDAIRSAIDGSDIVVITAGFGGGTGTGASPFVAEIARELGINCIAVVTLPFESESQMRMDYALSGIEDLRNSVQAHITLSNDLLLKGLGESVGLFSAFKHSNDVLKNLLSALVQMLTQSGYINVDMNDFGRILNYGGESVLGVGKAETEDEALGALEQALKNPLVDNVDISTAQGVIIQVCCRSEPKISTYDGLLNTIKQQLRSPKALIIAGVMLDPSLECEMEILLIATGIESPHKSSKLAVNPTSDGTENNDNSTVDYLDEELTFIKQDEDYTDIPAVVRQMQKEKLFIKKQ